MKDSALVARALSRGASFVDVRRQTMQDAFAERVDGDTRVLSSTERGACVRALVLGAWGFASTTGEPEASLADAAVAAARAAARASSVRTSIVPLSRGKVSARDVVRRDPFAGDPDAWLSRLARMESRTRGFPEVRSITLALRAHRSVTSLLTSEGRSGSLESTRVLLQADVIAE
ncbi:MAG TPA: DNA gyrase modulator, partial [Candidatus Thermoplasmatota archaeon]|nr:DNA gyrase modulator [Candidatus Thermoplasmatota archaeon]